MNRNRSLPSLEHDSHQRVYRSIDASPFGSLVQMEILRRDCNLLLSDSEVRETRSPVNIRQPLIGDNQSDWLNRLKVRVKNDQSDCNNKLEWYSKRNQAKTTHRRLPRKRTMMERQLPAKLTRKEVLEPMPTRNEQRPIQSTYIEC